MQPLLDNKEQVYVHDKVPEPVKIKKTKNVTIKNMTNTSSWRLESEQDIDQYLAALRKALLEELEGTDIVNVEF